MAVSATGGKLHWNYFLALDRDLEALSRFVEFAEPNLDVYSLEIAHLLFAAASEVDVVAKLVCEQIDSSAPRNNIDEYRSVLLKGIPSLPTTRMNVPRYGLSFHPWESWSEGRNPDWWRSYNKVKHERNNYFQLATLKNALNALGALAIVTFYYYARQAELDAYSRSGRHDVTRILVPAASLLRFDEEWYVSLLALE